MVYDEVMNDDAFGFWKRVDELKGKMTLSELSVNAGIKYQQVRHLRSENRYPKTEEIHRISLILKSSSDYLISGIDSSDLSPEMEFVRDNPLCRKIVRFMMEDEHLLEVVAAFVESSERRMKQADNERKEG